MDKKNKIRKDCSLSINDVKRLWLQTMPAAWYETVVQCSEVISGMDLKNAIIDNFKKESEQTQIECVFNAYSLLSLCLSQSTALFNKFNKYQQIYFESDDEVE